MVAPNDKIQDAVAGRDRGQCCRYRILVPEHSSEQLRYDCQERSAGAGDRGQGDGRRHTRPAGGSRTRRSVRKRGLEITAGRTGSGGDLRRRATCPAGRGTNPARPRRLRRAAAAGAGQSGQERSPARQGQGRRAALSVPAGTRLRFRGKGQRTAYRRSYGKRDGQGRPGCSGTGHAPTRLHQHPRSICGRGRRASGVPRFRRQDE